MEIKYQQPIDVMSLDIAIKEIKRSSNENIDTLSQKMNLQLSMLSNLRSLIGAQAQTVNKPDKKLENQLSNRIQNKVQKSKKEVIARENLFEAQQQNHKVTLQREAEMERKKAFLMQEQLDAVLQQQDHHNQEMNKLLAQSYHLKNDLAILENTMRFKANQSVAQH